jgi:hypothetical protein
MKYKALILFLCSLWIVAGCSFIQDTYDAVKLANEMQELVDDSNRLMNQQIEIDKIMTNSDPNTIDKAKIQKALDEFKRAKEQVIPSFEQSVKKVQKGLPKFEVKVDKLENGEVKRLAENTMKEFQAMMEAELAYAEAALNYTNVQSQFFEILKSGKEPSDAEIDKFNSEYDKYGKAIDQINAKIDLFNKNWEKLANKSGAEI